MLVTDRPSLPDLQSDHTLLCTAVQEAGDAVLRRYRGQTGRVWAKGDLSPVSEADLEADEILLDRLTRGPRAEYGWLSEESTDDKRRLKASRVWIVDPIDGTRAFLEGKPEFSICGALVEDGDVVASAVYNPATDEFFEATRGGGARCNGTPLSVTSQITVEGCRLLGWRGMFAKTDWPTPWPDMSVDYRCSTAYRLALVAQGTFDAAIALVRKADWDVAPGALLVTEAGGCATDHHGQQFQYNRPTPVQGALVSGAAGLYPDLLSRLSHLPEDLRQKT